MRTGPDISNPNGAAITLANNDRVGGITISEANVGILGNSITNTTLEQNTVFGGLIDGYSTQQLRRHRQHRQ